MPLYDSRRYKIYAPGSKCPDVVQCRIKSLVGNEKFLELRWKAGLPRGNPLVFDLIQCNSKP